MPRKKSENSKPRQPKVYVVKGWGEEPRLISALSPAHVVFHLTGKPTVTISPVTKTELIDAMKLGTEIENAREDFSVAETEDAEETA